MSILKPGRSQLTSSVPCVQIWLQWLACFLVLQIPCGMGCHSLPLSRMLLYRYYSVHASQKPRIKQMAFLTGSEYTAYKVFVVSTSSQERRWHFICSPKQPASSSDFISKTRKSVARATESLRYLLNLCLNQ